MKPPYLITSDQHCHSWSQFSKISENGVNSRLQIILDELTRAYDTVHKLGGHTAFMAGDLFHVRGRIEPSVFNPTFEAINAIHEKRSGFNTFAIPGNHDLEGKDATSLGNAMQTLSSINGFEVDTKIQYHHPGVIVVPWFQSLDQLRLHLRSQAAALKADGSLDETDVIIHAPVNGIIKGIPDHGLEPDELAELGFRRVFAGHYHDHKVFCDGKVVSVGATTHQTWGDVGTKAGFLLVYEDRIEHYESQAPKFLDLHPDTMPTNLSDLNLLVMGNYVRLKLDNVTEKDIKDWRHDLEKCEARGINIIATKKVTTGIRSGAASKSIHSLDESVEHYVRNDLKPLLADDVSRAAQEILNEARA